MGLIRAWRDEPFALFDPADGARLATIERAAARFWGTLTLGAHANGYLADDQRPAHPPVDRAALADQGHRPGPVRQPGRRRRAARARRRCRRWCAKAGRKPDCSRRRWLRARAGSVLSLRARHRRRPAVRMAVRLRPALPADLAPHNQDGEVAELPLPAGGRGAGPGRRTADDGGRGAGDAGLRAAPCAAAEAAGRPLAAALAARRVDNAIQAF